MGLPFSGHIFISILVTLLSIDILGIYFLICKLIRISITNSIIFLIYLLGGVYIASFLVFPHSKGSLIAFAIFTVAGSILCFLVHLKVKRHILDKINNN